MIRIVVTTVCFLLLLTLLLSGCTNGESDSEGSVAEGVTKTPERDSDDAENESQGGSGEGDRVADFISQMNQFSTLLTALEAAQLTEKLNSESNITFIAPTDAAFAKLGLDENNIASSFTTEELQKMLLYHQINMSYSEGAFRELVASGDVTMANGVESVLRFDGSDFYIDGSDFYGDRELVDISDSIRANNSFVYMINTVLMP